MKLGNGETCWPNFQRPARSRQRRGSPVFHWLQGFGTAGFFPILDRSRGLVDSIYESKISVTDPPTTAITASLVRHGIHHVANKALEGLVLDELLVDLRIIF
jgi:hypothetical protein